MSTLRSNLVQVGGVAVLVLLCTRPAAAQESIEQEARQQARQTYDAAIEGGLASQETAGVQRSPTVCRKARAVPT